jgi:hypothetical protein
MSEKAKEDVQLSIARGDTYELFAMLIGHSIINHQKILSNARRLCQVMRDEIERWKYGRPYRGVLGVSSIKWRDPLETFPNTLSDSDFYTYFESILKSWHEIQFGLAAKPSKFADFPVTLLKNLREENTQRNHLVHSEYTWDPDLTQGEEIRAARPQNSSGARNFGHFQIKTINRADFLEFVEYQYKIMHYLEGLQFDLEMFLYDEAYISAHSSEFNAAVVQFAQSEEVSPGSGFFSEEFEDHWNPTHSEIQGFLAQRSEALSEIENFRLNLKMKSVNYIYSRMPPTEGSTLSINKDTIVFMKK